MDITKEEGASAAQPLIIARQRAYLPA